MYLYYSLVTLSHRNPKESSSTIAEASNYWAGGVGPAGSSFDSCIGSLTSSASFAVNLDGVSATSWELILGNGGVGIS